MSTDVEQRAAMVIARLESLADPALRADMQPRSGIPSEHALGVPMREMKALARERGTDHDLAEALWATGLYEARTVAVHVADPAALTAGEMDGWCAAFDSWAIVDTACFSLFDRTPHAWAAVGRWAADDRELVRRAGFALLWALALHDKTAPDDRFADALHLVEAHADDDRHLVEKAIAMAIKAVGKMRPSLRGQVRELAERLAARPQGPARRIGRSALREVPAP